MVPPFATAYEFCASHDGSRKSDFLTAVPAKTKIFLRCLCPCRKSRSWQGYWDPKRKLVVTTHFSEIIKLQFGNKNAIRLFVF